MSKNDIVSFEWDDNKNLLNQYKHGVSFELAQYAFYDKKRVIAEDSTHSNKEERFYCFGKIDQGILTIRFTYILFAFQVPVLSHFNVALRT